MTSEPSDDNPPCPNCDEPGDLDRVLAPNQYGCLTPVDECGVVSFRVPDHE